LDSLALAGSLTGRLRVLLVTFKLNVSGDSERPSPAEASPTDSESPLNPGPHCKLLACKT
jgi:hypothetical protein